ncbi:MG2 domain-containing protein [Haloferula sp. BvORR071]|uniref:alpha-2-macroglobulin family protein n=1 Tax=Haloferula sp. BvORR071 TaxID=1396141 RepID=UPI0005564DD1|nr:MG2 domain-containing protein [Haloferula sp. BvORR071]
MGVASTAFLSLGTWQYLRWRVAHKPRPVVYEEIQKVTVSWSPPAIQRQEWQEKDLTPTPLVVKFSLPSAPMDKTGKEPGPGIALEPPLPGKWEWTDSETLVFTPQALHWLPGTAYTVRLDPDELAPKLEFSRNKLEFTTPPLGVELKDFNFYTSPKDPSVHQLVGELRFTHPVNLDEVNRHVGMEVLDGTPIFKKGEPDEPLFTVTQGAGPRQFFVRSRNIDIPEHEHFVKLRVTKGLNAAAWGQPLPRNGETKTRVPDKFSGFQLSDGGARIIRTDDGEPQQFVFIQSSIPMDSAEVAKHITAWWRDEHGWNLQDRAVLEQQIAAASKIALTPVASEAPLSNRHAFRFTEPRPGFMLLRIEPGVKAPGGFELGRRFEMVDGIPEFPQEVEILGKGNILTLGGAKKLVASSRGIDHLQITFGRVPISQVQHLVTQNRGGSFDAPDFWDDFGEDNLAQCYRKIVTVPRHNDWEAVQTEIDLGEARPMTAPDQLPGARGIFFIDIKPTKKVEPAEVDTSVYGRIENPYDGDEGNWKHDDDENRDGFADGWMKDDGESDSRFVMVTDLGLMVKVGADGGRDLFVMSLTAGLPIEGVALKALARNGTVLAEALTDAQGRAKLPPLDGFTKEREAIAVLAAKAQDVTFLPLRERQLPAMDFSRFDIEGVMASRQKAVEGFLFTERGIYRPGDTVNTGALVRRRDWEPVLEGLPVRLQIFDSQGRQIGEQRQRMPYDGFFEAKFEIPETAPLGNCEITAHVLDGDDKEMFRLGRTMVKLEEFQPDRSKVNTSIEPAPPAGWMKPEAAVAKAAVASLFGDAAAERQVGMHLDLSPSDFSFPEWKDYTFHDRSAETSASRAGRTIDLGMAKTDDSGIAEFKLPLETLKDASYRLVINTEAFEREGGRSVRHTFSELVSPWNEVLGWKADGDLDYIGKDSGRGVRVVAIDRALKSVALPKLHRRLIEIRQVSALTQLNNGNYAYVSTSHERVAAMDDFSLAEGGSDLPLATGEAGNFRLEIVDGDDAVLCAIPYRVAGKGEVDRTLEREAELELVLGQGEVKPGGEVEVHLTAPYAGAGVVTLERDRVLSHQWFHTSTNQSTVKLKVPADIEGTVYVNAAFVRSPSSPEVFHSPLSYAAAPLRITPLHKQMEVKLDTPKVIRPGSEAKFGFSTNKESRLVLYAVDEGIHQITNYKLPKPLDYFTRKQALEVRTLQWLDLLLPEYQFMKAAPAFGGDGDEDLLALHVNPFKRRQEAPVVFWSGIVPAGPQRHEVTWKVPDYFNGNLRVMAVAANAGSVGVAESSSLVKAPIILVPNTPLFVSPGDEFEASIAVTNNLDVQGKTAIRVSASSSSQLEPVGNTVDQVELEPGKEGMVRFRFKALDELGGAELKFTASGGPESVARATTLSVRPASHFLTKVQSGWFRMGSQDLEIGRTLYPQFRRGEAICSALPLGLAHGLEAYVSEYPHGCSEQITSRAMVKLLCSTEADFGLPPSVAAEHLRGAIAQLANRQQANGGFGYWYAGAPRAFDFHSLYVLHFLTEAKLLGHAVPEAMMKGALAYAGDTARAEVRTPAQAELQAYAIYLLARNGSAAAPQLVNLRDTLTKTQAGQWEGRSTAAWMAASYGLLKQDKEAEKLMKACLDARKKGAPKATFDYSYYNSDQAEELKIFYVRCRHFPKQAREFGYEDLEPVMAPLKSESFNTLTASFMTLALKAYGDVASQSGLELAIYAKPKGGSSTTLAGPTQGVVRAEFAEGTTELSFRRDQKGAGDIGAFYQSVQAGFDRGKPPGAQTSGIGIFREIKPAKEGPVHPGDAIDVKLTVRNLTPRQLSDIAVIDLLPAGFEVVAGDLKSGPGAVPGTNFSEVREDRSLFYLGLAGNKEWTVTYRMKAVCPGSFIVPSALVEDMYDRGRHGLSEPGRIEVVAAN